MARKFCHHQQLTSKYVGLQIFKALFKISLLIMSSYKEICGLSTITEVIFKDRESFCLHLVQFLNRQISIQIISITLLLGQISLLFTLKQEGC